ncbi:hypothetical protein VP01_24g3 [Puccinia sorghi]|uniref:Uncharacterized protein n=1 Tax=Puccinia sorghi TaxID=27349 RepID=A0A0L6V6B3_9BASI|nr:hypothetical protein VP01_24g3 [Puccinia sorghi]
MCVRAIIGSIGSQIKDEDCLAAEGSNYAIWCDFINKKMRDMVNKLMFWPNHNSLRERIGRSIILSLVSIQAHINDILDELKTIHINFTQDDLAGLVLQNCLASEPQLAEEFDCHVEMAYQSSAKAHVMYLDTMIRIINVIHHGCLGRPLPRPSAPSFTNVSTSQHGPQCDSPQPTNLMGTHLLSQRLSNYLPNCHTTRFHRNLSLTCSNLPASQPARKIATILNTKKQDPPPFQTAPALMACMVELGDITEDLENIGFKNDVLNDPDDAPIVYSGASHHFCGGFKLFSNFHIFSSPIPLKLAIPGIIPTSLSPPLSHSQPCRRLVQFVHMTLDRTISTYTHPVKQIHPPDCAFK